MKNYSIIIVVFVVIISIALILAFGFTETFENENTTENDSNNDIYLFENDVFQEIIGGFLERDMSVKELEKTYDDIDNNLEMSKDKDLKRKSIDIREVKHKNDKLYLETDNDNLNTHDNFISGWIFNNKRVYTFISISNYHQYKEITDEKLDSEAIWFWDSLEVDGNTFIFEVGNQFDKKDYIRIMLWYYTDIDFDNTDFEVDLFYNIEIIETVELLYWLIILIGVLAIISLIIYIIEVSVRE